MSAGHSRGALPAVPRYERLALRLVWVQQFVWLRDAPLAGA